MMDMTVIAILTLHIRLPECNSLKEKRGRLQPVIHRLHHEFNLSVAEVAQQDSWREAVIACALVSNDLNFSQRVLSAIPVYFSGHWPDLELYDQTFEYL